MLQALVAAGAEATILFSTHQIADVEQIADRVAILDHGRTIVSGALDELRERWCRVRIVLTNDAPDVTFEGAARVQRSGRVLTVLSSDGPDAIVEQAGALQPVSIDVLPVSLKELFLEMA